MTFKSGFAAIIGRPNVGKSTLLNSIAQSKVAITSSKPQTTRNAIRAVYTKEDFQIVFVDTPGIHRPKNRLSEFMVGKAEESMEGVDVLLFMVEATDRKPGNGDMQIIKQLKNQQTPAFLLLNKIDLVKKEELLPLLAQYNELMDFAQYIPISAAQGEGISILIEKIKENLPEGPSYFPEDILTDQPERTLAAELVREKALELMSDEIPHGIGVEVTSFHERDEKNIIDIEAVIFCEKDSHKGMIIGKEGKMLKRIGTLARMDMEGILGAKVFLQLWVKVKPDWRNSAAMLRQLGYSGTGDSE